MKKTVVKKTDLKTPVRLALVDESSLLTSVSTGLGAIESAHRDLFDSVVRPVFADSLDLDKAMKQGREEEHRWDYLLGHEPSGKVVAVEPHSARTDEVQTVIKKRAAARRHLKDHLREGTAVQKWLWVAPGKVRFADTEKTKRLLDQHGIEFIGTKITIKHLPSASGAASSSPAKTPRRKSNA